MAAYLDLATNIGFSALIPRRVAGKRKIWKETGLGDLRQPRKMAVTPPHTHTLLLCPSTPGKAFRTRSYPLKTKDTLKGWVMVQILLYYSSLGIFYPVGAQTTMRGYPEAPSSFSALSPSTHPASPRMAPCNPAILEDLPC